MASNEEIYRSVGELQGRVTTFIDELREERKRTQDRLGAVEKKQYWLGGVAAAAVFVVQHYGSKLFGGSQI